MTKVGRLPDRVIRERTFRTSEGIMSDVRDTAESMGAEPAAERAAGDSPRPMLMNRWRSEPARPKLVSFSWASVYSTRWER